MKIFLVLLSLASLSFSTVSFAKAKAKTAAKGVERMPTAEPEEKAPARPPFFSEEDVDYAAATKENMLGFMRPAGFVGILIRPYSEKLSLRQCELYEFTALRNTEINTASCERVISKIVGPVRQISLKYEGTALFKTNYGMGCEIILKDLDPQALAPDRHLFAFNLKKGLYILNFQSKEKFTSEDSQDVWKFIRGLK